MPGDVSLSLETLFGFLLVLARVGGAFAIVPLPGISAGPQPARVIVTLGFTMALFPMWPAVAVNELTAGRMLVWMLSEAAFGITVGLAVAFLIETLLVASQVFGLQAGYSYASTIDPSTEADSNVLLVFSHLLGGLLFFALGLDRQVIRVFAASLASHAPGSFALGAQTADVVLALGASMFTTGLRLAMPVVALLLLVDIALALLSRINQQLQLLTLAFPAKMMATLAFLAAISVFFLPAFRGAAENTFSSLLKVL